MADALDPDALLCASVLAPGAFSRNKFYELHDTPGARRARKKAKRLRGIIRQLLGHGREKAEVIGEQILDDGRVLLRYRVQDLAFQRTTALTPLEAAVLRYALHLAGQGSIEAEQRELVQGALARLAPEVDLNRERPSFLPASRPPTVET